MSPSSSPHGTHARSSGKTADADLVIVGAGVAGLAAARTARAHGLAVDLLEAKGRIGGRALTDRDSLGVAWDRGCQWLHQARRNPFARIADRLGFHYWTGPRPQHVWLGERWADECELAERDALIARIDAAVDAAAAAGRDVASSQLQPEMGAWGPLVRQLLRNLTGEDPDATSALDESRYAETGDNWPVVEGYGALVAAWGGDTPVRLNCPVRRIARHAGGVTVEGDAGTLRARMAIVTASTNVLSAGGIRFDPPLPDRLLQDLHDVPAGAANKVALRTDGDPFGLAHAFVAHRPRAPRGLHFLIRPFGRDLVLGHLGGPLARELEAAGHAASVALAVDSLAEMFGQDVRRRITGAATTAWTGDPWIRGGYSVCRPGRADARARLSQPVDETLLLAGEACSLDAFGTANGAYDSGVAAARRACRALGFQTSAAPDG